MKYIDNIREFFDARNTLKEADLTTKALERRNKELNEQNGVLSDLCNSLEARLKVSGKYLDESKEALDAANKKLKDLKKLVREQTEADLLLVSKQIEKRILEGKKIKKEDPIIHQQNFLQQQLGRMNEMENRQSPPGLPGQAFRAAQNPFNL